MTRLVTRHSETINKIAMLQSIEKDIKNNSDKSKKWRNKIKRCERS